MSRSAEGRYGARKYGDSGNFVGAARGVRGAAGGAFAFPGNCRVSPFTVLSEPMMSLNSPMQMLRESYSPEFKIYLKICAKAIIAD